MQNQYVIALDQGTTSSRAIIFDREQNIVAMAQKEFTQHYPKPGWVEHDPMEIYSSQYGVLMEVLAQSGGGDIHVTLEIDGDVLTRKTVQRINDMTRSAGSPPPAPTAGWTRSPALGC